MRGPLPGGRGRYSARDPELGLWVHATLVDSTIVAASEWLAPLDRPTRARLYEESLVVGRGFGIPDSLLPADLDAFERYLAAMTADGGPVAPGPLARDLAASILAPPLGPPIRTVAAVAAGALPAAGPALDRLAGVADRLPAGAATWLLWPAIGLLPDRIRDGYGFAWGPVERAVAGWLVAGWRAWNGVLPAALRSMPQAVAADRRIAGA